MHCGMPWIVLRSFKASCKSWKYASVEYRPLRPSLTRKINSMKKSDANVRTNVDVRLRRARIMFFVMSARS